MSTRIRRRATSTPALFAAVAWLWACGSSDPVAPAPSVTEPAGAASSLGSDRPDPPPPRPTSWKGVSSRGAYTLVLRPEETPIPLNRIHRWLVDVSDAQGARVVPEAMSVGGGMPDHGHGFNTSPVATPGPDGQVVIDGMQFHMAGTWRVDLGIMGPEGFDAVSVEILVGP